MPASKQVEAGRGESGRKGDDVRSDLHVAVTLTSSGGLDVGVTSRVAAMYGDSIRQNAVDVLDTLGVDNAQVEIDDKGALPFVIAARVEAAARRAGVEGRAPPAPRHADHSTVITATSTAPSSKGLGPMFISPGRADVVRTRAST